MEQEMSMRDKEVLALKLLASLPRARLAAFQQQIAPLLQFDIVGSLPTELALQVFGHLPSQTLLLCSLINRRWQRLANDQSLWKRLCRARGWAWRQPPSLQRTASLEWDPSDDEGIGDSDEDYEDIFVGSVEEAKAELTMMHAELDSGFLSMGVPPSTRAFDVHRHPYRSPKDHARYSAPSWFNTLPDSHARRRPDYKLLHQTHVRLRNRFLAPSYRLSPLQTKGSMNNGGHNTTIYCLQLYTDPETGQQVLFTGSRDRTVREWNLTSRTVERVIGGVHSSSVLSICAFNGYLATAGSDRQVALWDLRANKLLNVISDHEDSVLCVRFNDEYLVSCSKDRTVRVYDFPSLRPLFVLDEHRAAVNTVSLSGSYFFTGSGDRSIRLWDAKSGKLLHTFDNHHTRGIASIDFKPPIVVSGSSDKHIRIFDITTLQGWSTFPEHATVSGNSHNHHPLPFSSAPLMTHLAGFTPTCPNCGQCTSTTSTTTTSSAPLGFLNGIHGATSPQTATDTDTTSAAERRTHNGLVRSIVLGDDFVISGSYDLSIKVWDRKTGALVADLTGGHTGRIFCIAADYTKIVSCGEDQTICIWDFSHGIDTSFLQL